MKNITQLRLFDNCLEKQIFNLKLIINYNINIYKTFLLLIKKNIL